MVSVVVPFWGYLIRSLLYIWLNQKKAADAELSWAGSLGFLDIGCMVAPFEVHIWDPIR